MRISYASMVRRSEAVLDLLQPLWQPQVQRVYMPILDLTFRYVNVSQDEDRDLALGEFSHASSQILSGNSSFFRMVFEGSLMIRQVGTCWAVSSPFTWKNPRP